MRPYYVLAFITIQEVLGVLKEPHNSPIVFQKIPKECRQDIETLLDGNAVSKNKLPNMFFNPSTFFCEKCKGENEVVDPTGMACECAPGFIVKPEDGTCEKCENGFAPNRWRSRCVKCGDSFAKKEEGTCLCSEDSFQVMQDIAEDGAELETLQCKTCPEGEYPGLGLSRLGILTDPNWECKKCDDPLKEYKKVGTERKCTCKEGYETHGDKCVLTADYNELEAEVGFITEAFNVKYKSLLDVEGQIQEKTEQIQSRIMTENFVSSAIGCKKYKKPEDCQILANLCVLNLYDQVSQPCKYLNKMKKDATEAWNNGIPNIEYLRTEEFLPKKYLTTSLTENYKLKPEVFQHDAKEQLSFYLAQYHMNGSFLGFSELSSQLSICEMTYDDVKIMKRFGSISQSKCTIHMDDLKVSNEEDQMREANTFFEVFLEDSEGTLIDVPVIITNWDSGKKSIEDPSRSRPNLNHDVIVDTLQMVRRFFIIDTISGIKDTKTEPSFVRWAQTLEFKIQMDQAKQGSIFRPHIVVYYQEKNVETITQGTQYPITFQYEYYSDFSSRSSTLNLFMGIFIAVSVFYAGVKVIFFTKRNPRFEVDDNIKHFDNYGSGAIIFKYCLYFSDLVGEWLFWILFGGSATIFIQYKQQMMVTMTLPEIGHGSEGFYNTALAIFIMTLIFRQISVILHIWEQTTTDIFMIDHELPSLTQRKVNHGTNAWRQFFIANEFAELNYDERYVNPDMLFIWFIFFYIGLGWQFWAQSDPFVATENHPLLQQNQILVFFVASFIFLATYAVMRIIHSALGLSSGSALANFVDLCTMANTSIIVLKEQSFGYYIHGKAPWLQSDIPLEVLQREIFKSSNDTANRGLKNQQNPQRKEDQVQTFKIYLPFKLLDSLHQIRKESMKDLGEDYEDPNKVEEEDQDLDDTAKLQGDKGNEMSVEANHILEEEYKREEIIRVLRTTIADGIKANQIHQCSYFNTFFGAPPVELPNKDIQVVEDHFEMYPSIDNVLFCNLDYQMLQLYILYFILFEIMSEGQSLLALFAVYIIQRILKYWRQTKGTDNLCSKTYIDEVFLS